MLAAPSRRWAALAPIVTRQREQRFSMTSMSASQRTTEWAQASNGPRIGRVLRRPNPSWIPLPTRQPRQRHCHVHLTDSTGATKRPGHGRVGPVAAPFFVRNFGVELWQFRRLSECSAATTPCRTDAPYYSFYDDPKMWPRSSLCSSQRRRPDRIRHNDKKHSAGSV